MRSEKWMFASACLILLFTNCGIPTPIDQEGDRNSAQQLPPTPEVGNSPPAETEISKIAGLYASGTTFQAVFPDGEYWNYGGYGIIQMRHGKIVQAAEGQYQLQVLAGSGAGTTVTGMYQAGVRLGTSNKISNSETAPSLNIAAGDWWGNLQDGDTPYLNISSTGSISGRSANFSCTFTGNLVPHPSGFNLFKLTIVRRNCLGSGQSETFTGIARVTGRLIHFAAVNAAKTRILTWEGYPN